METSFDPLTTSDTPLAAESSFAASAIAFSALGLFARGLVPDKTPPRAAYKLRRAIPSSDGFNGRRASALEPVKLIPVSN